MFSVPLTTLKVWFPTNPNHFLIYLVSIIVVNMMTRSKLRRKWVIIEGSQIGIQERNWSRGLGWMLLTGLLPFWHSISQIQFRPTCLEIVLCSLSTSISNQENDIMGQPDAVQSSVEIHFVKCVKFMTKINHHKWAYGNGSENVFCK
jgi:hypothetical protein